MAAAAPHERRPNKCCMRCRCPQTAGIGARRVRTPGPVLLQGFSCIKSTGALREHNSHALATQGSPCSLNQARRCRSPFPTRTGGHTRVLRPVVTRRSCPPLTWLSCLRSLALHGTGLLSLCVSLVAQFPHQSVLHARLGFYFTISKIINMHAIFRNTHPYRFVDTTTHCMRCMPARTGSHESPDRRHLQLHQPPLLFGMHTLLSRVERGVCPPSPAPVPWCAGGRRHTDV